VYPNWLDPISVAHWLQSPEVVQGELYLIAFMAICLMGVVVAVFVLAQA
jgi:hypothetical protein